tara:strand:+ start:1569 stop:6353 length:4785 start_codon:yes stop_codon:yes gene_type:complete
MSEFVSIDEQRQRSLTEPESLEGQSSLFVSINDQKARPAFSSASIIHNPPPRLEGINKRDRKKIREIYTDEDEAKSSMSAYLSQKHGLNYEFTRNNYNLVAAAYGYEGLNATAHFAKTVQQTSREWNAIRETEKRLGKDFQGHVLQSQIPLVRHDVQILAGTGIIGEHAKILFSGAEQAFYGFAAGTNQVVIDILKSTPLEDNIGVIEDNADFWRDWATKRTKDWNISQKFEQSMSGKIAKGIGGLPVYGVMAAGGLAGAVALTAGMYEEGAMRYNEIYSEEEQSSMGRLMFAMPYALIAQKLERVGFDAMLGKVFKESAGKLTLRQIAKRATSLSVASGTETGTEIFQQMLLNAESMAIDPDNYFFTTGLEVKDLLVISAVSTFGSMAGQVGGVAEDIRLTFQPSPLTSDGSSPTDNEIKAMLERLGEEELFALHQETDPRRDALQKMMSDNPTQAQEGSIEYQELTTPTVDARLPLTPNSKEIVPETRENILDSPLLSKEEIAAIEDTSPSYFSIGDTQIEIGEMSESKFQKYQTILEAEAPERAEAEMVFSNILQFGENNGIVVSEGQSGKHATVGYDDKGNIFFDYDSEQIEQLKKEGKLEGSIPELLNEELIHMAQLNEYKGEWNGEGSFIDFVSGKMDALANEFAKQNPDALIDTLKEYADVNDSRLTKDNVAKVVESLPKELKEKVIAEATRMAVGSGKKYTGELSKLISIIEETLPTQRIQKELEKKAKKFSRVKQDAEEKLGSEVKKRIDVIQKMRAEGQSFRDNVKSLSDLVSSIPTSIRGTLTKRFKGLANRYSEKAQEAFLKNVQDEILQKVDKFRLKEAKANFLGRAKTLQKEIEAAKGGNKSGRKNLKQTERLLDLMGFGDGSTRNDVLDRLEVLRGKQESENYQLTDEDNQLFIESAYYNVNEEGLTASEYESYLSQLERVHNEGVDVWTLQKQLRRTKNKSIVANLKTEVQNRNKERVKKGDKLQNPAEADRQKSFFKDAWNELKSHLISYQTVGTILSGKKRGRITKWFDKMSDHFSDGTVMQHDFKHMVENRAKELGINLEDIGNIELMELNGRSLNVSQAMFLYSHSQNRASVRHAVNTEYGGRKIGSEGLAEVTETLPDSYKSLVDMILDYNDNVMFPRMSELYEERMGIPMPKEERYMAIINLVDGDAFSSIFQDFGNRQRLRMNNQKERKGSKIGFAEMDFISAAMHSNFVSEHAIHMHSSMMEAEALLSDKGFVREIDKVDPNINKFMREYVNRVARGKFQPPSDPWAKYASMLRTNVSAFYVSVNVGSYAKVAAPMIALKKEVDAGVWLSVVSRPDLMREYVQRAQAKSNLMKARPHESRIEIGELSESKFQKYASSKIKKAQEKAYMLYTAMDMGTTAMAWNMGYIQAKNNGDTEPEAVSAGNHLINTFFPAGRVDQVPLIFSSGSFLRQMTTFTADMNRMGNLGYSITQLKDNRIQEAILFAAYPVFLSSLFLGLTDIPNDWLKELLGTKNPPEDRFEQWVQDSARYGTSQVMGGIPFFSGLAEGMTAKLMGDDQMARFLSRPTMVMLAPLTHMVNGDYTTAAASVYGVPTANYWAPVIDDYIKEMFD